jgi:CBS domain-containing protein
MAEPTSFDLDAFFGPEAKNVEAGRVFAQELQRVRHSIAAAPDGTDLQRAADGIQALVHRVIEHAPAEPLTRLISTLNDALTRRVIELTCAGTQLDTVRWCWIALGSEGRQEQTLTSDQDNGIIFDDSAPPDALREMLLPLALRINQGLAACGFALCSGQIMASNPKWCLSLQEWRERFLNWIIEGDPQALLNATIFFDLRPLYGARDLAQALADWLAVNASDNPRFLFQMTENALRREAPLGMLRDFVVEKGGEFAGMIDLKHNAATLFVDAARVYSLACGSRVSNTADRLRQATQTHRLEASEVEAWIRAFYFIQTLRLKNQRSRHARGAAMHNHVDPNQLGAADRRALLDALQQARALQKQLALAYLGSGRGI